ncbi:MAG: aldehyde dehydrogenase family protein, partial [Planctomycetes bacterium]|nr:aldehyde dehydrogenase family protein [Planctomycetota bacterium]
MSEHHPLYCAGKKRSASATLAVYDKYSGEKAFTVSLAGPEELELAIAAAAASAPETAALPAWKRRETLDYCAQRFRERAGELARVLSIEAGKPIKDARGEVERLIDTFLIAAEESVRQRGHILPLDRGPRTTGYTCYYKRVPLGPVTLITPFNFPLNLVAHKVAPAIAAGCPFVLKPASATPLSALLVGEVLTECAHLPAGSWSVLPCRGADAGILVSDERLKGLSFTGSPTVGWALKAQAGKKRVLMELGGNAACIVDADCDLEDAVARIIVGAFYQSGQS